MFKVFKLFKSFKLFKLFKLFKSLLLLFNEVNEVDELIIGLFNNLDEDLIGELKSDWFEDEDEDEELNTLSILTCKKSMNYDLHDIKLACLATYFSYLSYG